MCPHSLVTFHGHLVRFNRVRNTLAARRRQREHLHLDSCLGNLVNVGHPSFSLANHLVHSRYAPINIGERFPQENRAVDGRVQFRFLLREPGEVECLFEDNLALHLVREEESLGV